MISRQLGDIQSNTLAHTLVSSGLYSAAGVLSVIPGAQIAAPFVALAGAISQFFFKPDLNKIATTKIVDQVEVYMKQNLANWEQLEPNQKTTVNQQAALNIFSQLWQQVQGQCGNPSYGSAGVNCIGDRQRGGKWDWFKYYYDPIANDPNVNVSVSPIVDNATGNLQVGTMSVTPSMLIMGIIGLGLIVGVSKL